MSEPRPEIRQARAGYLLFLPALVLMIVLLILPVAIAAALSASDYALGNPDIGWVGTENYSQLLSRSSYRKMMVATLAYVLIVTPASVALGLGAALLIRSLRVGQAFYKTVYFLPVMASLLAMAIVWEFALHPTLGIVNRGLETLCGVDGLRAALSGSWAGLAPGATWFGRGCAQGFPLWLGDPDYAIWSISFIGIWQGFGFSMVLYLAGLSGIPPELYHAAEMDGVRSGWELFRLLTWPMLAPTTVFVVTVTTIRSFQVFDTVEALTDGGPVRSTYTILFAIYEKAIRQNLVGVGAALTVVFLAVVMAVSLIQRRLVERKVHA